MKILLTGSTGYIGRRLLPVLVSNGHHVVCMVRDQRRFDTENFNAEFLKQVTIIEADLEKKDSLNALPEDIDVCYYLVHSMSSSYAGFSEAEKETALNFADYVKKTKAQQIIYLSGIANDEELSEHLTSRKNVEDYLKTSGKPLTVLRAAIIIGSGSASFEIIRDLVEKLPVMIAPKWLNTTCQPIGIRNVIEYLCGVLGVKEAYHRIFDIGGPDQMTYKEMLLGYAKVRKLKRYIITVPVLSPKLSSLWLYFVTSTSYPLARNLVDSMRHRVVVKLEGIDELVPVKKYSYIESLEMAFSRISQKNVISSWKDAVSNQGIQQNFLDFIEVPQHGCFNDTRTIQFDTDAEEVRKRLWSIGGSNGWYYGDFLWGIRGLLDKTVGGVGLRRGRRSPTELKAGDALDFWRVLAANESEKRLLLYAEMKLPGEAWLEFKIREKDGKKTLIQTATFRPLGLWGRIYWYSLLPFHFLIFPGMAARIVKV